MVAELRAIQAPDWRDKLATRNGRILGDERNIIMTLRSAPPLLHMLRFNSFALRIEFVHSPPWREAKNAEAWRDEDTTGLILWLQTHNIEARFRGAVWDSVALVARDTNLHPVRQYLRSCTWDGTLRIDNWLQKYLGVTGNPAYITAVSRKFLISAVARIEAPGCQVDHALILEGPQGIGKSSAARILARRREWFCDSMPDLRSKDAAIQLAGAWIIELSELAALRRAEVESVKAFISRCVDRYRPPYGRTTLDVPRQGVFFGSTNEQSYLRDRTGNRRFWPVQCGRIDLDALTIDRDQLWAEAFHAFGMQEPWHLTAEESALAADEQGARVRMSELEVAVHEYLERISATGHSEVTVRQVIIDAAGLDPHDPSFMERCGRLGPEVTAAMCSKGWVHLRTMGRGVNRRNVYHKPL